MEINNNKKEYWAELKDIDIGKKLDVLLDNSPFIDTFEYEDPNYYNNEYETLTLTTKAGQLWQWDICGKRDEDVLYEIYNDFLCYLDDGVPGFDDPDREEEARTCLRGIIEECEWLEI